MLCAVLGSTRIEALLDALSLCGLVLLVPVLLLIPWTLNRVAERRKLAQTRPAEEDEEVRVRPGYTLRVSPRAVSLVNFPSSLLVWVSLLVAGAGIVGLAAPLTLQAYALATAHSQLQTLAEEVLGEGTFLGGCLILVVLGGALFGASRRRIELVLESQGAIRYRRERFLRRVEEWEIEPSSFVELVATPRGRAVVSLVGRGDPTPRYVFDCAVRTNLEEDIRIVSDGLRVLAASNASLG